MRCEVRERLKQKIKGKRQKVKGSIYELPEYQAHDIGRNEILNDFGITVIRFTNEQIIEEIDSIIDQINITAKNLLSETP